MSDADPSFSLGLEEPGATYVSGSQRARVFTESWVAAYLFCPARGAGRIALRPSACAAGVRRGKRRWRFHTAALRAPVAPHPANRPVADFHCAACAEEFELKSQRGRFGPRVTDGAYGAKLKRLASDTNPNLALMNYDLARFSVTDRFWRALRLALTVKLEWCAVSPGSTRGWR